ATNTTPLLAESAFVADSALVAESALVAAQPGAPAHVRYLPADGTVHTLWQSEPGIWNAGLLLGAERPPVARIVLPDHGVAGPVDDVWEPADGPTLLLNVRGRGVLSPRERDAKRPEDQASSVYKLLSDLIWLGDSLAAGQVFDVLRAIDIFAPDGVTLVGAGYGAYLARLTAFLDPRVRSLSVCDEFVDPD